MATSVNRLRVLHVRNCRGITDITGAETHLLALLERGSHHGVESLLVCMTDPRRGLTPWLDELGKRELAHETIPIPRAWSLHDLREVAARIDAFEPDLVHTLDHRADVVGVVAARRTLTPVVATFHGWTNWPPTSLRGRLYPWLDRRALARTNLVVTNSEAMARDLAWPPNAGPPIITLPNGVDTDTFDPSRVQPASSSDPAAAPVDGGAEAITIGMVARLHPNKGQLELLDIVPALLASRPNLRVRLVGDAPPGFETYGEAIARRIAEPPLRGAVTVGPSTPGAMPAVMASIDVLAAPSVTESFSFSLLEAMAMERPVVATAVGGTPELVEDGATGLLVPAGDRAALARALERLLDDAPLRQRLGREARRRVRTTFSLDAMVAATVAAQRDVVDCRRLHGAAPSARDALRGRLEARAVRTL